MKATDAQRERVLAILHDDVARGVFPEHALVFVRGAFLTWQIEQASKPRPLPTPEAMLRRQIAALKRARRQR